MSGATGLDFEREHLMFNVEEWAKQQKQVLADIEDADDLLYVAERLVDCIVKLKRTILENT